MSVGAQSLRRARSLALSAPAFRRLTLTSAVMLVVIVATGATVRLTGSGLGCEHWPGCEPHHFEPRSFHSYIEFGNRVVAFFTILVTLATWLGSLAAKTSTSVRVTAFVVFLGTLAQAPLGAITVYYHLNPWLVLSHFLLSVAVLTLAVALAVEVRPRMLDVVPGWVRVCSVGVWVSLCVLIVSGTLATAAGRIPAVPSSGGSVVPAGDVLARPRDGRVRHLVRAAVVLARPAPEPAPARRARRARPARRADDVGEIQYRTHLPWWLVLVHVTLAATVWAAPPRSSPRSGGHSAPHRMAR